MLEFLCWKTTWRGSSAENTFRKIEAPTTLVSQLNSPFPTKLLELSEAVLDIPAPAITWETIRLIKKYPEFLKKMTSWCLHILLLFSCSVVSDSLWPHGLQHTRLPCPSLSPWACSNSCSLSRWCHPTMSSCRPLLFLPSIVWNIKIFSNELALRIRWPELHLQHQSFQWIFRVGFL